MARLTRSLQRRNAKIENRLDDFHRFPNNECVLTHNEPRQPGGCKLKTAPVRPVVAARPAE
ncbi:hypothetical protein BL161_00019675, partial [Klebsiella pneumoniae]